MRARCLAPALLLCLYLGAPVDGRDFDASLRAAMRPYYAALVASARGDAEATRRQLVLFEAQWSAVQRERTTVPRELASDPKWPADLAHITSAIARTKALLRTRDVQGAHAELETVRNTLRDARARHGLTTMDDLVLEFHEAVERLVTRVPHRNEIKLRPSDFAEFKALVDASHRQWDVVCRNTAAAPPRSGWDAARARIDAALRELDGAVQRQDAATLSAAAAALKNGYYELLLRM